VFASGGKQKVRIGGKVKAQQIEKMMPVSEVYAEYSKFDIHKLKKPEVQGKEYQEGRKKGFLNSQAYVLCRDQHECKLCKKSKTILQ